MKSCFSLPVQWEDWYIIWCCSASLIVLLSFEHHFLWSHRCVLYLYFSKVSTALMAFSSGNPSDNVILLLAIWCVMYSPFLQVGIPVAAGMLLPVTGTMLSPSIAGALMGLSSIGVMSNSLLLRLRFQSIEKDIHKTSLYVKAPSNAENRGNENARLQHQYPAARWGWSGDSL